MATMMEEAPPPRAASTGASLPTMEASRAALASARASLPATPPALDTSAYYPSCEAARALVGDGLDGVCCAKDNRVLIAAETVFPEGPAESVAWWFSDGCKGGAEYRLWHPEEPLRLELLLELALVNLDHEFDHFAHEHLPSLRVAVGHVLDHVAHELLLAQMAVVVVVQLIHQGEADGLQHAPVDRAAARVLEV